MKLAFIFENRLRVKWKKQFWLEMLFTLIENNFAKPTEHTLYIIIKLLVEKKNTLWPEFFKEAFISNTIWQTHVPSKGSLPP